MIRVSVLLAAVGCHHPVSPTVCEVAGSELLWHETAGNSASPELVTVGDGWLAVWEENDGASPGAVMARPLGPDGEAIGAAAAVGSLMAWGAQPQVADAGSEVVLTWLVGGAPLSCGPLAARTLGPDGQGATPELVLSGSEDAACTAPAVAWTGDRALVVWAREPEEDRQDLWVAAFAPTEGWGPPRRITDDGGAGTPRVRWTDDELLLTWMGLQGQSVLPLLARLDRDGAVLSGPTPLLDDPTPRYVEPVIWAGAPAVVVDRRHDEGDARILVGALRGDALGELTLLSGDVGSVNDVSNVPDGDLLAAAWSDDRGHQVHAAVVDGDGLSAAADLTLGEGTSGFGMQPTVAPTPGGFLTMWRDTRDRPGGDLYTRAIRCE